ncbi:MAG: APC family permease [Candidatus Bathyarchaeota archaeon]|nr:APC family permease [Candidatus Bathyarchaeota archaeon]
MSEPKLRRELGLLHAVMLGVGASIGAGAFVMLGQAAAMAGPAIIVVVLLGGVINLFTIFSFCELGAAMPEAGGEHLYIKVAYGGLPAFITGWFEWMSEMFYAVLMAVGSATMISYYIPVNIPITAIGIVLIFTLINVRGAKGSGTTAVVLGLTLLVILAIYVVSGLQHGFGADAFQPFMPKGVFGMLGATAYIFVIYLGSEDIVVAQGEIKEPGKTIPRALLLNAGLLIAIYGIIACVTVGMVPTEILGELSSPLAFVAEKTMGWVGAVLLTIAGLVAAMSSLNTAIMAQSRVVYSMSKDGYFPKVLSAVHRRFGTPHISVIVTSIFTLVFTAIGAIEFAAYAASFGFIIGYSLTNFALMKLRRTKPHLKRPFKAPLCPFTPIVGIVASLGLLPFMDPKVLALGAGLGVLALLAYYLSMVGHYRIRVAFGGMSLGIGVFAALLAYLIETGLLPLVTPPVLFYVLIFVSAVSILAGVLNVTTPTRNIF